MKFNIILICLFLLSGCAVNFNNAFVQKRESGSFQSSAYGSNSKQIRINADSFFVKGDFNNALDAYYELWTRFPHDVDDKVALNFAISMYHKVSGPEYDQRFVEKAIEFASNISQDSQEYLNAQNLIVKCQIKLAEHDLFVARGYSKRGEYKAAQSRLLYLIENFPLAKVQIEQAKLLLNEVAPRVSKQQTKSDEKSFW